MGFEQLIHKVHQAEDALEARERTVADNVQQMKSTWLSVWTPGRIIVAGLATGFLTGRAEPLRAITGPRLLQMVSTVSALFASAQATVASVTAEDAAQTAEAVASGDGVLPEEPLVDEAFDDRHGVAPRPAEAATELSER